MVSCRLSHVWHISSYVQARTTLQGCLWWRRTYGVESHSVKLQSGHSIHRVARVGQVADPSHGGHFQGAQLDEEAADEDGCCYVASCQHIG